MISPQQLHIARVSLGWSLNKLGDRASVSANTIRAIESGSDYRASSMRALAEVMAAEGILFLSDGSVAQKMTWEEPKPASPEVRAAALQFINSDRKRAGKAPLIDAEDGQ